MIRSPLIRRVLLVLLGLSCMFTFAGPLVAAAEPTSPAFLQANIIYELMADRARMIQVSVLFVAVGCAMIWWYR